MFHVLLHESYCYHFIIRIYGGTELAPHHLPSIVRMRIIDKHDRYCDQKPCGRCGASILNDEWLITAGHCCTFRWSRKLRPVSTMSFSIGAHHDETCEYSHRCNEYTGRYKHVYGTVVQAKKIVRHKDYHVRLYWDFCLVQVDPMQLNGRTVDRIYLPGSVYNQYRKSKIFYSVLV